MSGCRNRDLLKIRMIFAVLGAALIGGLGQHQVAASLPTVVRIGYIAEGSGSEPVSRGDPAAIEVAAHVGLLGARLGAEEMNYTARMEGRGVALAEATAQNPDQAVEQARRLAGEHVVAFLGGFDPATAVALSKFAQEHHLLFFNVGATDDRLRNEECSRLAFHVEASDAMYLDANADWFIRGLAFLVDENAPQGVQIIRRNPARTWFLVTEDTPTEQARRRRLQAALEERHWGGRIVADVVLHGPQEDARALRTIPQVHPDLVFLLLSPSHQLAFYRQAEQARLAVQMTGFPDPATQTRAFFGALLDAAPRLAHGSIRIASWEPTFAAIGGPQLSQRFLKRWKQPMDGPAWTSWLAVKIVWDAVSQAQTTESGALVAYLESDRALFDGYQGIGMTFRPWDHQLRHPVMASRLETPGGDTLALAEMVGQFPNVLAPGRSPNQVLDQLGDTAQTTRCHWQ